MNVFLRSIVTIISLLLLGVYYITVLPIERFFYGKDFRIARMNRGKWSKHIDALAVLVFVSVVVLTILIVWSVV